MNLPDPIRPLKQDSQAMESKNAEPADKSNDLQKITQPVL